MQRNLINAHLVTKRSNHNSMIFLSPQNSTGPSTALVAVALQDHLAKQYSLSINDPLSKKRTHQLATCTSQNSNCSRCGKGPHYNKHKQQQTGRQTVIAINSDILALNTNCDGRETVQPSAVHHAEQTVAASHGGIKGGLSTSSKEVEHVLDKVPPPLSLAQRMGLVEAPPTLLSNAEWAKVKSMSVHRHDSASPCPICHEPFGLAKQVIRITVFVSVNSLNNLNCTAQYNALLFQCAVLPVNAMTTLPVGTIIVLSCVSFELPEIPGAILSQ